MGPLLSTKYNNCRSVSTGNYYGSVVFGQYNDMHMLYSNYMVLFTLVDLQSQCMGRSPNQWTFVLERCL